MFGKISSEVIYRKVLDQKVPIFMYTCIWYAKQTHSYLVDHNAVSKSEANRVGNNTFAWHKLQTLVKKEPIKHALFRTTCPNVCPANQPNIWFRKLNIKEC